MIVWPEFFHLEWKLSWGKCPKKCNGIWWVRIEVKLIPPRSGLATVEEFPWPPLGSKELFFFLRLSQWVDKMWSSSPPLTSCVRDSMVKSNCWIGIISATVTSSSANTSLTKIESKLSFLWALASSHHCMDSMGFLYLILWQNLWLSAPRSPYCYRPKLLSSHEYISFKYLPINFWTVNFPYKHLLQETFRDSISDRSLEKYLKSLRCCYSSSPSFSTSL